MANALTYLKAAFLAPANLLGLAGAAGASALLGDPTPAMVALGVEGLYLGILSSASQFQRAVRAREEAKEREHAAGDASSLLGELSPSQREHYLVLRELRDKILANYRKLPGGGVLSASSEAQVDALLTAFLRLLGTLNSYRKYLNGAGRRAVEEELKQLEAEVAVEESPRVREVKAKRVEILRKRVQRFVQAEESRELVSHQLAGIEDLLRLTHEQSIAIRDPEGIVRQLDALSAEVQATEGTVREMERFMDFSDELGPPITHGTRVR